MTILKKSLFVAIAVATMSAGSVAFTTAPANATHYGHGNYHAPTYHAPKRCHWGWVRWKDSYGQWHRKWKQICN